MPKTTATGSCFDVLNRVGQKTLFSLDQKKYKRYDSYDRTEEPPFENVNVSVLSEENLGKSTKQFSDFVVERLPFPCKCHSSLEKRWDIFIKIQNGMKLDKGEGYALVGHIDEEWHTDKMAPGYIYIYKTLKKAKELAVTYSGPKVLFKVGKLYMIGCPKSFFD